MKQTHFRLRRHENIVLALVLGASLALYGCSDDDDGTKTPDGSVTLPDGTAADTTIPGQDGPAEDGSVTADMGDLPDSTVTDSPQCCTQTECEALGQTCNTSTCQCEPSSGGCTQDGDPCDLAAAPVSGFVCIPDEQGTGGICRVVCDPSGQCPGGFFCAAGDYCAPSECDGFFANTCPAGEKCFPVDETSYVCIDSGTAQEGDACESQSDCGLELICAGGGECVKADCTPLSTTKPCTEANALCEGWVFSDGTPMDVGYCWIPCAPFADPTGCPAGQWCFPTERDATSGQMDGVCVEDRTGTAAEGEACETSADCANSLLCGATDACQALCDKAATGTDPGACATGTCQPNRWIDSQSELVEEEWGVCIEPCTPWSADPVTAGCTADTWCEPDWLDPAVGQCYDGTGTAAEGETCGDAPDPSCMPGMFCGSGDGECLLYCAPEASAGTAGDTCSPTQFCWGSAYTENGLPKVSAVGYCVGSCDYDTGTPCTEATETCVPLEMFDDTTQDVCVAGIPMPPLGPGDDCTAAGVDEWYFCGPLSVCMDISMIGGPAGITCQPFCRASAGSLGTSGHPDCPASQPECTEVFTSGDFGLCLTASP